MIEENERKPLMENKSRTPSGNVIAINFENIRSIFSQFKVSEQATPNCKELKINQPFKQRLRSARNSDFKTKTSSIVKCVKPKRLQSVAPAHSEVLSSDEEGEFFSQDASEVEAENYFTPPATPARKKRRIKKIRRSSKEGKFLTDYLKGGRNSKSSIMKKSSAEQVDVEKSEEMEYQASSEETVKAVNIHTVLEMFKKVEDRLKKIEEKQSIESVQVENTEEKEVSKLQTVVQQNQKEIENLKKVNLQMKSANRLAYSKIDDLSRRLAMLEVNTNRRMVSITGLYTYGSNKEETGREL